MRRVAAALILLFIIHAHGIARGADAEAPSYPGQFRSLDERVKTLKKDLVELSREFQKLERELMFPSSTQVAVFVSMDQDSPLDLDSVQLKMDEDVVANHLYSAREINALQSGGVHRLYIGNLRPGEHALQAELMGEDARGNDINENTSLVFTKKLVPEFIELKIINEDRQQPEFRIKQWE